MRKALSAVVIAVAAVFLFSGLAAAQAKVVTLNTCWMPEHETYIAWKAAKEGWDKAEGIELKLLYFDSGMAQMEALPAKQWVLGSTGGPPMLVGALRHRAQLVALANDESLCNEVFVRAGSPIMGVKGKNPQFPNVHGSAETVKGKTVLCTTVSGSHYMLSSWLKTLGLKDSDVTIKNMDQAQAVAAFESGVGDMVSLWAPFTYQAAAKGWKSAADMKSCGAMMPLVIVADRTFAEANPELVAKFLKVYLKAVDWLKKEGVNAAPEYRKFMKDWGGLEITEAEAKLEIEKHPIFSLNEQLAIFDASKGPSQMKKWMQDLADFFTAQGRFKKDEMEKVMASDFITDKYLKMVK